MLVLANTLYQFDLDVGRLLIVTSTNAFAHTSLHFCSPFVQLSNTLDFWLYIIGFQLNHCSFLLFAFLPLSFALQYRLPFYIAMLR